MSLQASDPLFTRSSNPADLLPLSRGSSSGSSPVRQFPNSGQAPPELLQIIRQKQITSLYQPIVDLCTGNILGYEALSRGPADSPFQMPQPLFAAATKHNQLLALEQVCREIAVTNFHPPTPDYMLFLNMNADVIHDPHFKAGFTREILGRQNISPASVVFEITERTAIDDFESFCRSLQHYRQQGYQIAIDDAGAGYSSLQAISEIKPDYIKLDKSIVASVHQSPLKQSILESMVKLARIINSKIIAEGVELEEELSYLVRNGIHYAQGYLLARPQFPLSSIPQEVKDLIVANIICKSPVSEPLPNMALGETIGHIAHEAPALSPTLPVKDAETMFTAHQVNGLVVTNARHEPVGLLMKDKLYYQLGTKYGVSLYHHRPVELVMDKSPLVVNADLPLEAVSQMAMNRDEYNLYDLIVVVRNGRYYGAVSVMTLLNTITNLQIRRAHNSNPLTGLPGNLVIEDRLKNLLISQQPFAVFYIDLDNFKAYNDKYGFERGDQVLLLTSQVLSQCIAHTGQGTTFLGHIGGDDFVIITAPGNVQTMGDAIIQRFDKEILSMYQEEDLDRGYITVKNRRDEVEQFPLISISLAVASTQVRSFDNFLAVGEVLAELKKLAKKRSGSCLVIDRRGKCTS
ncbi:MAG TPA: bifunctional diguanylate cyclase/phosphodiesterase [Patescibacteria group bacterium]|nr:bifunctional diguanylate cyclase/phosphodiesterase [Patescibacteria group bacterium]